MIVIRPATIEDAVWLSSRLRSEDITEVETATGQHPEAIVPESFRLSEECYTVRRAVGDQLRPDPVAIFGVVANPAQPDEGLIWFLGTDDVRLCALSVMRESGYWLNHLSRRFSRGLRNFADRRNSLHVRWCLLTGFTLSDTIDINGAEFYPIHRPAPTQCVTL